MDIADYTASLGAICVIRWIIPPHSHCHSRPNAPLELRRDDIASVHQVTRKSATKATLIGLGVGAGAGAAVGATVDARDNNGFEKIDNAVAAVVTVLAAGIEASRDISLGEAVRSVS